MQVGSSPVGVTSSIARAARLVQVGGRSNRATGTGKPSSVCSSELATHGIQDEQSEVPLLMIWLAASSQKTSLPLSQVIVLPLCLALSPPSTSKNPVEKTENVEGPRTIESLSACNCESLLSSLPSGLAVWSVFLSAMRDFELPRNDPTSSESTKVRLELEPARSPSMKQFSHLKIDVFIIVAPVPFPVITVSSNRTAVRPNPSPLRAFVGDHDEVIFFERQPVRF